MHQVLTLRSFRRDTCLFESGRLCQTFPRVGGVCKWLKRAVLQTVALGGFAGSSPATPVRPFHVGRSSTGRALPCECSTLRVRVPPADLLATRGVSQARTKARDSLSRTRGFESRTPCQSFKLTTGGIHMKAASARAHENDSSVSTDAAAGSLERLVHVPEKAYEVPRPTPSVPEP